MANTLTFQQKTKLCVYKEQHLVVRSKVLGALCVKEFGKAPSKSQGQPYFSSYKSQKDRDCAQTRMIERWRGSERQNLAQAIPGCHFEKICVHSTQCQHSLVLWAVSLCLETFFRTEPFAGLKGGPKGGCKGKARIVLFKGEFFL